MYSITARSRCPINLAVEVLGDQWTLVLLRDMIFADRRHFRELLAGSAEGISPAVLADRLKRMQSAGLITREGDKLPGQRARYSLTAKGFDVLPILGAFAQWGLVHCGADPALAAAGDGLDLADLQKRHGIAGSPALDA
jgi:DNA-binding HxlR family transcriptional regulator